MKTPEQPFNINLTVGRIGLHFGLEGIFRGQKLAMQGE